MGVETAGAAKKLVGKDSRVYACYRVKRWPPSTASPTLTLLGKLEGISGTDLQEAVAAVPAVQLLCGQADTLTDTFNAVRAGIGNIEVLGVKLPIGGLPGALTEFTCEP